MIALVLLALGLGVALTAYELSPSMRASADDYARVIREAHEAHRVADAALNTANLAANAVAQHAQAAQQAVQTTAPTQISPPVADAHSNAAQVAADAGVDHVMTAVDANQEAARQTAAALQKAKTEAERAAAVESAAKVSAREKEIADALAKLGVGQCGVRSYERVTAQVRDALLAKLRSAGMTVTGNNPWNIDPQQSGVKLRAVWDPKALRLKLIVTSTGLGWCSIIWDRIEPKMKEVLR